MTDHIAARAQVLDELRDRLALARRWLLLCLDAPRIHALHVRQDRPSLEDPLAKALMRHWMEATRTVPLDALGIYLKRYEAGQPDEPATAWLSRDAVRAVYLIRELARGGLDVFDVRGSR